MENIFVPRNELDTQFVQAQNGEMGSEEFLQTLLELNSDWPVGLELEAAALQQLSSRLH